MAAELLRACAFLAPDAIPEELLVEILQVPLGETETREEEGERFSSLTAFHLDQAVTLLRSYSLVQRNGSAQTLSIHRLVQVVVREAIEEQMAWITRAIRAVNRLLPAVNFATWERCARYVHQALHESRSDQAHRSCERIARGGRGGGWMDCWIPLSGRTSTY